MSGITRRSFVTSLFGAVAAAPLVMRLEGIPTLTEASPLLDLPTSPLTYDAVLAEARRLFDAAYVDLAGALYTIGGEVCRIGDVHRSPASAHVFTSQLNVGFHVSSVDGDITRHLQSDRTLPAAMRCMALRAVEEGLGHFGGLIVPKGIDHAAIDGPLRMCVAYDVLRDEYLTRFDVLGAKTPQAERAAVSRKVARRKAEIKQRLSAQGQAMSPINPFLSRT